MLTFEGKRFQGTQAIMEHLTVRWLPSLLLPSSSILVFSLTLCCTAVFLDVMLDISIFYCSLAPSGGDRCC